MKVCSKCKLCRPRKGRRLCGACLDFQAGYELVRRRRFYEKGLCTRCGKPRDGEGTLACERCKEMGRARWRAYYDRHTDLVRERQRLFYEKTKDLRKRRLEGA